MATNGKEYKLAVRIAGIVDKSYDVALTSANASLKGFKANMNKIDGSFRELDKGFNKIMSAGKACFHAIATAAGVAAVAVGAVTAASIKVGSEFEAEMSTVQAISQATDEQLTELSDKAREVAKETVFSASEVGQAMEFMGMAGWKTEEMLSGIEGVVKLAAASGEEMATVSSIVVDTLTAMGHTADDTGRFVDILAQAAMNSNTNVELMGDTFKYAAPVVGSLGYSMEDLAIATGLMASSGIKGSLAGTALRNMLTRMVKPTKESQNAIDALGLSLTDEEGNMYSLLEIMQKLRENFADSDDIEGMNAALRELAGLTDEQIEEVQSSLGELSEAEEAFYAAELGGQRGMSGLLAIANSTDEQFLQLTEAIYNAEGAVDQMANVRLDNLKGDITILKDTAADAGIEFYYQFKDNLRGIVQEVTAFVGKVSKHIPEAFKKVSEAFPTLKRKFTQYAKPVFDAILSVGKWVFEHGRGIIAILAGIGAALAAYKIASTASHLITSIMKLASMGPVGWIIMGVAAAITAVVSALTYYKLKEREAIDNNLADHFGNIALSLEELQKIAEYVVSTGNIDKIREALNAYEGLDEYTQIISSTTEALNKMNWKIQIGMELTPEEQEEYQKSIEEYIKAVEDFAVQGRYAVHLNLTAIFGDDDTSGVVDKVDRFYQDQYGELTRLGGELADAVSKGFEDNFLDEFEVQGIIKIQQQMAEIQKALALGEYDATLSAISTRFSAGQLTADSFQDLQAELKEAAQTVSQEYEKSYIKAQAALGASLSSGYLTQAEYDAASETNKQEMLRGQAEANIKAVQFMINSIEDAYGAEIKTYNQRVKEIIDEYTADSYNWDWEERGGVMWMGLIDSLQKDNGLDSTTEKAIGELLDNMSSQIEMINNLANEWDSLTPEMQTDIAAIQQNLAVLGGMTSRRAFLGTAGDTGALSDDLANRIFAGGENAAKTWLEEYYENVTTDAYQGAQRMADQTARDTQDLLNESFSVGFDVYSTLGIHLKPSITIPETTFDFSLGSPYGSDGKINGPYSDAYINAWNAAHPGQHARGGLVQSKELSWLAEEGPEMVVPLDGSQRAVSLWEMAGRLLGMSSLTDRFSLDGATSGGSVSVEYSPTLQFYGEAPSRKDLDEALKMSQDEFNDMMENYLAGKRRVSFA